MIEIFGLIVTIGLAVVFFFGLIVLPILIIAAIFMGALGAILAI